MVLMSSFSLLFHSRQYHTCLVPAMSYVCFTGVGRERTRIMRLTSPEASSVLQTVTVNEDHVG
jgi:hypothetical protein